PGCARRSRNSQPPPAAASATTPDGKSPGRRCCLGRALRSRIVVQDRAEPAFGGGQIPAFTPGVVLDLVALDLAGTEIAALGMAVIETGNRRARPHGVAYGQLHSDLVFGVEQLKQSRLLAVLGLCRVAGRRADGAVLLRDQLVVAERLVRRIAPEDLPHTRVQPFCKGLGQR